MFYYSNHVTEVRRERRHSAIFVRLHGLLFDDKKTTSSVSQTKQPPLFSLLANMMCAITDLPNSNTHLSNSSTKPFPHKDGVILKQPTQERHYHRRNYRVSFADASCNRIYRNTQWSKKRARKQWYTAQEFQAFKEANFDTAQKIHKKSRRVTSFDFQYKQLILHIYDACAAASNEQEQEDASKFIAAEYQSLLRQAFWTASYRIGLEKTFLREIAHDKKYRRHEVAQRVLQAQAHDPSGDRPALMRLASMSVSRTSRLFAHYMAVGLAASLV